MNYFFVMIVLFVGVCTSCSTTRRIPSGEQLYTGIQKIEVMDDVHSEMKNEVMTEIEAALSFPPNNALLGSSTIRVPIPLGLWAHNTFADKKGKFNQWMYNFFAAEPVLISTVNPEIRAKIAQNLLKEYGFFNGKASYQVITDSKDTLKAKIRYELTMNQPYLIDSIQYRRIQRRLDTLEQFSNKKRLLKTGDQFSAVKLENERQRISSIMRDNGYFYFRPEYITYDADSTLSPHKVSLRVGVQQGLPGGVMRPWKIGKIAVNLYGDANKVLTDSVTYKDLIIRYQGKLRVKPEVLYSQIRFKPKEVYSLTRQTQTQTRLNQLGIFRFTEMQYVPKDSTRVNDTLNVQVNAVYDLDLNGEIELNFTANNNKRIGPGAVFSLTKSNAFGGGESLGVNLNGNYEWLLGSDASENRSLTDNYEYGITGTLMFPRIFLPDFFKREYDFPATSTMQLYANRLNRADYFRLIYFGGSATYDFLPDPIRHHAFVPFKLTFNRLEKTTEQFENIAGENPVLYESLKNQFIPAMSYTYTLDNSSVRKGRHMTWWQLSVSEAGNLLSGVYALAGKGFNEPKKVLGNPFAQFLRVTTELRYNHAIDRKNRLVARLGGGIIYSYGNSEAAPYSERFYVGGANSIRAYTIRTVGPGRFPYKRADRFISLDHVGDFRVEGNLEYRFNLIGNLEGALFLDAGNVWLLRESEDANSSGGMFQVKHLLNDIAIGTGVGARYKLDILVIRLDLGFGLHLPYDTGKRGYWNAYDKVGFHIAVGYPF